MPSSYLNDLRIELQADGENASTWGQKLNDALTQIGDALAYGTQDCFATDANATTTVADGAADPARAMYFKVTSTATLTATRTLTIAPNTISRVMFIENATTGSQSITISQGSGSTVTIATGKTAVVYLDGAGATAAVVDAMAKVDPGVTDTLAEVLVAGNTSGGTGLTMSSGDDLTLTGAAYNAVWDSSANSLAFADNAKATFGDAVGGDLQIYHNGSASYITDSGTGDLVIGADTFTYIANAAGTKTSATFNASGAATLRHDNAAKLATTATGIDVTGTVVADGLESSGGLTFTAVDGIEISGKESIVMRIDSDDNDANRVFNVVSGTSGSQETLINASEDAGVSLYYDNAAKIATTSTGIDVTGTIVGDGLTIDGDPALNGNVTITSTASGALAGPYLTLDRNSSSPADSDLIGILSFRGRDDGANVADYGTIAGKIADVTDTTEDGVMLFTVLSGGSSRDVLTLSHNESVFNNGGADQDFRVESNNQTHALFVDAGNDRVGIFNSSPAQALDVAGNILADGLEIEAVAPTLTLDSSTAASLATIEFSTGTTVDSKITHQASTGVMTIDSGRNATWNGKIEFITDTLENLAFSRSLAVFNEDSNDIDFRVESDNNTHALFVDAGNSRVGINNSAPNRALDVDSGTASDIATFQNDAGGYTFGYTANLGSWDLGASDALRFRHGATETVRFKTTESVFNELGADIDFRVESDSNTHQLAVDAEKNNVQINNSNVVINSDNGSVIVAKGAVYYSQVLVMSSPYTGNVQIDLDYSNWGSNNVIAAVDVMILTRQFNTTSGIAMGKMFATNTGSGGQFVTFTTTDITTSNCTFTASSPNNYRLRLTVNPSNVTDQVSIVLTLPILATSALSEITAQIV